MEDEASGGELNHAIANAMVRAHKRHVGRGPQKAQAFFRHNVVVVVMQDTLTRVERTLAEDGKQDDVRHIRHQYQLAMREDLIDDIQRLTGCCVDAFMSDSHIDPDLSAEVFVLDRPIPGELPDAPEEPSERFDDHHAPPAQGRADGRVRG